MMRLLKCICAIAMVTSLVCFNILPKTGTTSINSFSIAWTEYDLRKLCLLQKKELLSGICCFVNVSCQFQCTIMF